MLKQTQYRILRLAYVVLLIALSLFFVYPFIIPITLAASIALALYPFQIKLENRKWKKERAAALITTLFTLLISLPFLFFLAKGSMLVVDLLEKSSVGKKIENQGIAEFLTVFKNDIILKVLENLSRFPILDFISEANINLYIQRANIYLLEFFKSFALNVPSLILFLLIMIACTFSFLNSGHSIRNFFQSIFGFNQFKMNQLVVIFLRDARQVYVSNVVTGAFQSSLVATGVYLIMGADWFLIFFVTLIFSFIPVLGAAPVAFLFALVAFLKGSNSSAVILVIIGSVSGIVDNFLRPWLASLGESKVPTIVSFVFVIGGALLLGFPGLFIGLLVGAITYDTLPIFWKQLGTVGEFPKIFSLKDKHGGEAEIPKQ